MTDGVTGRELAQQLRAQKPQLKVIYMTGYGAEVTGKETDVTGCGRGRDPCLRKPCPANVLLQTVRQCLDGK